MITIDSDVLNVWKIPPQQQDDIEELLGAMHDALATISNKTITPEIYIKMQDIRKERRDARRYKKNSL